MRTQKQMSPATPKSDVEAAWERFEKRLDRMTREEKLQTFVDAGILTKKGNLTKPYRGTFVKVKA